MSVRKIIVDHTKQIISFGHHVGIEEMNQKKNVVFG